MGGKIRVEGNRRKSRPYKKGIDVIWENIKVCRVNEDMVPWISGGKDTSGRPCLRGIKAKINKKKEDIYYHVKSY